MELLATVQAGTFRHEVFAVWIQEAPWCAAKSLAVRETYVEILVSVHSIWDLGQVTEALWASVSSSVRWRWWWFFLTRAVGRVESLNIQGKCWNRAWCRVKRWRRQLITKVEQPLRAARIKGLLLKHFCGVPGGPVMPTVGLGMAPISQTKRHLGWSPLKGLLNNS